jgi:hypothetical protein
VESQRENDLTHTHEDFVKLANAAKNAWLMWRLHGVQDPVVFGLSVAGTSVEQERGGAMTSSARWCHRTTGTVSLSLSLSLSLARSLSLSRHGVDRSSWSCVRMGVQARR